MYAILIKLISNNLIKSRHWTELIKYNMKYNMFKKKKKNSAPLVKITTLVCFLCTELKKKKKPCIYGGWWRYGGASNDLYI